MELPWPGEQRRSVVERHARERLHRERADAGKDIQERTVAEREDGTYRGQIRSFVVKLLYGPAIITRGDVVVGYFTKEAARLHARCQSVRSIVLTAIYSGAPANSPRCRTVSHEINPSRDLVQKAGHSR